MKSKYVDLGVGLDAIAMNYLKCWERGMLTMEMIADCGSVRNCLNALYFEMVRRKQIPKINLLSDEQKNEIRQIAKEYCSALSESERQQFVRAYVAFDQFAARYVQQGRDN